MMQPSPTAEIPAKRSHACGAQYRRTRRRCGFYPEKLRFAESPEYSKYGSIIGWAVFQPSTKPSHRYRRQWAAIEPARRPARKEPRANCPAKRVCIRLDRLSFCNTSPGCPRDRFEYLHVTRAAAKIPRESLLYVCQRGLRFFFEQMQSRKNHSRRANAALRATASQERLLQRTHQRMRRYSFDGNDARAARLGHGNETAIYQHPVQEDRA